MVFLFLNYMNSFQLLKKNYEEYLKSKNKKQQIDSAVSSERSSKKAPQQKQQNNPYLLKVGARDMRNSKRSGQIESKRKNHGRVTRSMNNLPKVSISVQNIENSSPNSVPRKQNPIKSSLKTFPKSTSKSQPSGRQSMHKKFQKMSPSEGKNKDLARISTNKVHKPRESKRQKFSKGSLEKVLALTQTIKQKKKAVKKRNEDRIFKQVTISNNFCKPLTETMTCREAKRLEKIHLIELAKGSINFNTIRNQQMGKYIPLQ